MARATRYLSVTLQHSIRGCRAECWLPGTNGALSTAQRLQLGLVPPWGRGVKLSSCGGRVRCRWSRALQTTSSAVRVCMCVIGESTCDYVAQLCSQSLRTLQLGSAACIHAFQLPPTSCTRHSCLRARCLHVYASQPTAGVYRVVRALVDVVASSVRPRYRCAGRQREFGPARRRIWPRWSSSDSGCSRYSAI